MDFRAFWTRESKIYITDQSWEIINPLLTNLWSHRDPWTCTGLRGSTVWSRLCRSFHWNARFTAARHGNRRSRFSKHLASFVASTVLTHIWIKLDLKYLKVDHKTSVTACCSSIDYLHINLRAKDAVPVVKLITRLISIHTCVAVWSPLFTGIQMKFTFEFENQWYVYNCLSFGNPIEIFNI